MPSLTAALSFEDSLLAMERWGPNVVSLFGFSHHFLEILGYFVVHYVSVFQPRRLCKFQVLPTGHSFRPLFISGNRPTYCDSSLVMLAWN